MANPEHLKILKQGGEVWNSWWIHHQHEKRDFSNENFTEWNLENACLYAAIFNKANLNGADLSRAFLESANFIDAQLRETKLKHADLTFADFSNADLTNANLSNSLLEHTNLKNAKFLGAILNESRFHNADVEGADFGSADLISTIFDNINFHESDIKNAFLRNTVFIDCNLSGIKNLETCYHTGPSILDYRTIAKSENLPISFLRGCGLPDFIIDNINVLREDAFIFYSCFISHSSKDFEFVNRLYSDLQNKGIRCWFAQEDMKGGKKSYDQINEAIRMHDKLLLVLSEESMKSDWVATEIKKARMREKHDKRQMLFPIGIVPYEWIKEWELFDADTGSDLAAEVRSYHIPDFSEWKNHDSYKKGLERVVRDLKGVA
jgi:uncharacterized protein YjbI with pentapeptide repeats